MGLGPGADLAGRGSVGRGSPQDRGSVQVGGSRNMRTLIEIRNGEKPRARLRERDAREEAHQPDRNPALAYPPAQAHSNVSAILAADLV